MADYGPLDAYLREDATAFEWAGQKYALNPDIKTVLRFQRDVEDAKESNTLDGLKVYEVTAPIFGSVFSLKTRTLKGGVLGELVDAGMPYTLMDRLIQAVYFQYAHSESLASAYMETGDLGKALQARYSATHQKTATQPDATEMGGDS